MRSLVGSLSRIYELLLSFEVSGSYFILCFLDFQMSGVLLEVFGLLDIAAFASQVLVWILFMLLALGFLYSLGVIFKSRLIISSVDSNNMSKSLLARGASS